MGFAIVIALYMFANYGGLWITLPNRKHGRLPWRPYYPLAFRGWRRAVGIAFPILTLLFLIYAYFGPIFPACGLTEGWDEEMIQELFLSDRGIWG